MGIDFGTKKVGLALTDESGSMAFAHSVIPNDKALLRSVVELITAEDVTAVVIGQSLNLDGTANPVQAHIEEFIADLTLQTPIPIHLEPEQLTSRQAATTTGRNDQIDAAAAALIVESFLAKQKNRVTTEVVAKKEPAPEPADEPAEAESTVPEISFDQFTAVEIKLGTIEAVDIVEDADRLLKLTVDLGEATPRQIVSGIREYYADPQVLVGRQCPFIANLAPRKIRGLVSQGMILAGTAGDEFALLQPSAALPAGTRLY